MLLLLPKAKSSFSRSETNIARYQQGSGTVIINYSVAHSPGNRSVLLAHSSPATRALVTLAGEEHGARGARGARGADQACSGN